MLSGEMMALVMDQPWSLVASLLALLVGFVAVFGGANKWSPRYWNLDGEKKRQLPPGDFGLPIIGNNFSFVRAFKSRDPETFLASFIKRYGRTGIYKGFMFGSPTIMVTSPETCKQVLMDDEHFVPGWPKATAALMGRKSFVILVREEHKRLRRLTAAPINGYEALSTYLRFIEKSVVSALDKWVGMGDIEFLSELRKLTFRVIMHIFLSSESESLMEEFEAIYTDLNFAIRAMAINIPGFAFHRAFKARRKLVNILERVITERRALRAKNPSLVSKDMMDILIETEGENGGKMSNEEIIDLLIMYLNAGHESSAHTIMWITILIQEHPEVLEKAKKEQEEIKRNMPSEQKGLTLRDIRKMEYLSKVIDETLRLVNISYLSFREATADVYVNGYLIPKGWKVQIWPRAVHLDPLVYPNPKEFNPSRFDGVISKPGAWIPFGGGTRLCPGNELAKLEISVFMHHFLLGYEIKRQSPECPINYLPHPKPMDKCVARITKVAETSF